MGKQSAVGWVVVLVIQRTAIQVFMARKHEVTLLERGCFSRLHLLGM